MIKAVNRQVGLFEAGRWQGKWGYKTSKTARLGTSCFESLFWAFAGVLIKDIFKRLSGGSAYADTLSANAGYAGGKGPV